MKFKISVELFILFVIKLKISDSYKSTKHFSNDIESSDYANRLPNTTIPYHYDLNLEVKLEPEFTYNGNVTIDIIQLERTQKIILHSNSLRILKQYSYLLDKKYNRVYFFNVTKNLNNDFLILNFNNIINNGIYQLYVRFEGVLNTKPTGLYRTEYTTVANEQRWIATTQFEPANAREMFPCFDEPEFKATFQLRIIHSKDRHAISNSDVSNVLKFGNKTMTSFKRTLIMSTYLLAVAVTDYDYVESNIDKKTFRLYVEPKHINHTLYAQNVTLKAIKYLENRLTSKYALNKLDQIVVPSFSGGMENWGLVVYGNSVLYNPNRSTDTSQERILNLVCHELAHQWFGNLVTLRWWSYVWLNEGFATYYGHACADALEPKRNIMDKHVVLDIQRVMVHDSISLYSKGLNDFVELKSDFFNKFDEFSYTKGSAIVRQIASVFENFDSRISKYLRLNAYSTVAPKNLFEYFENSKYLPPMVSAKTVLSSWTNQPGFPLITMDIDYESGLASITQKRFIISANNETFNEKWWIPLTMSTENYLAFDNFQPVDWIHGQDDTIVIKLNDTSGWTILNNQLIVYCRVNYDLTNWQRIINYLNGTNFNNIHYINRIQLIHDSMNLARAGEGSYEIALNLTTYLRQENKFVVWSGVFPNFEFLNIMLSGTKLKQTLNNYYILLIRAANTNQKFRRIDNDKKLNRNYVDEFYKKYLKLKQRENFKGKQRQLVKTYSILSDNVYSKNDFDKIKVILTNQTRNMDDMEVDLSRATLSKINFNIEYLKFWIDNYYRDVELWFKKYYPQLIEN